MVGGGGLMDEPIGERAPLCAERGKKVIKNVSIHAARKRRSGWVVGWCLPECPGDDHRSGPLSTGGGRMGEKEQWKAI